MQIPPGLRSADFEYLLPEERIAKHPPLARDGGKLLVASADGAITHSEVTKLAAFLKGEWTVILNETRVIPARLPLRRKTGGKIEVFLLRPLIPSTDPVIVLSQPGPSEWEALIGGGRPKDGETLENGDLRVTVLGRRHGLPARVRLEWEGGSSLSEIISRIGETPLPPYMDRRATEEDRARYQTVFAKREGSVAAPTASLHLTEASLQALKEKGHELLRLTLHVGAGTFRPMSAERIQDHPMHAERIEIPRSTLEALQAKRPILCAGTTSLRALESAVAWGRQLLSGEAEPGDFPRIQMGDAYRSSVISVSEALAALLASFEGDSWFAETSLFLGPGAQFSAQALLTNFHQPRSTLLCLVAGFLPDATPWRSLYETALEKSYRFLSYGDASLLFRGAKEER